MRLRAVEVAWRTAWMRAIARALPGPREATPPDWSARPFRVVYLRDDGVGDLIIATGAIRAIARSHPTITVDVLASDRNHHVLAGNPHVRRVVHLGGTGRRGASDMGRLPLVMRALRAGRYDVVVDGRIDHPPVFTSAPLKMLAAAAPYRVGAARGTGPRVYNLPVPYLPKTVSYTERVSYLAGPFGVDRAATSFHPELFVAPDERAGGEARWRSADAPGGTRLLVNLSAAHPSRRWPDDRFVEALRHVLARRPGLRVLVVGAPDEWASVGAVAGAVGVEAVRTATVREAFALVCTADLVLTPDTGISHAAAALNVPAVVLIAESGLHYAPCSARARLVVSPGTAQARELAVAPVTEALADALDGVARRP
jgi:ADP-heptose:LPS heptosyltransferase